jgi:hypothetical protein
MPHVMRAWLSLVSRFHANSERAPSPGRSDGATSPAEIGDFASAAASAGVKAAATGEQRRERRPQGLALTTSRAALFSPIVSAGWQALVAAGDWRAPREAQRGQFS